MGQDDKNNNKNTLKDIFNSGEGGGDDEENFGELFDGEKYENPANDLFKKHEGVELKPPKEVNIEERTTEETNENADLETLIAENPLQNFLYNAFSILNPSTKLIWNWHLNYLCSILEEVAKGNIRRLIINIPPRYLKSITCSVCFPAWLMGLAPTKRIIVACYSRQLAIKHSLDTRQIMQSDWYLKQFPETKIATGRNEKAKFCTTKNGFRFATSVQGTLTGEGGDILIADDPHNPVSIYNKAQRNRVINWFSSVFTSRLNNKKKGAIVVIMQRLHHDDLCGHLMEKDTMHEWTIVRLPVVAEKYEEYIFMDTLYKQRKIGDLLCRELEGSRELTQAMRDMGEYNFQAQYQQEPLSLHGNMIKPQWLRYFCLPVFQRDHKNIKYYISIDCASGIGTENDFTAISVFAVIQPKFYLCEMLRLKKPYPELKAMLQELFTNRKPETILIEDKSNGSSMIQDLRTEWTQIIPIKPTKSKESRVNDILTTLEAGNLLIADNQKWTQTLNIELLAFPECKHDDQVDTISQFINWWHNSRTAIKKEPTIRFLF